MILRTSTMIVILHKLKFYLLSELSSVESELSSFINVAVQKRFEMHL